MGNVKKKIATLSLGAALAISPAIFPGMLSEYAGFCMTCEAASHVDASLRPVQLAVNTHLTVDSDAEGDLLRSSRTTVNLVGSGQSTEALQQALWQYSKEAAERRQQLREGMLVIMADPMHFQMSDLSAGGGALLRECRVGKNGAPEVIAETQP